MRKFEILTLLNTASKQVEIYRLISAREKMPKAQATINIEASYSDYKGSEPAQTGIATAAQKHLYLQTNRLRGKTISSFDTLSRPLLISGLLNIIYRASRNNKRLQALHIKFNKPELKMVSKHRKNWLSFRVIYLFVNIAPHISLFL
jgi:hypothetical protein